MKAYTDKTQESKNKSVANTASQGQSNYKSTFKLSDNRQKTVAQRKLQKISNNSSQIAQLSAFHDIVSNYPAQRYAVTKRKGNSSARPKHPKVSRNKVLQAMLSREERTNEIFIYNGLLGRVTSDQKHKERGDKVVKDRFTHFLQDIAWKDDREGEVYFDTSGEEDRFLKDHGWPSGKYSIVDSTCTDRNCHSLTFHETDPDLPIHDIEQLLKKWVETGSKRVLVCLGTGMYRGEVAHTAFFHKDLWRQTLIKGPIFDTDKSTVSSMYSGQCFELPYELEGLVAQGREKDNEDEFRRLYQSFWIAHSSRSTELACFKSEVTKIQDEEYSFDGLKRLREICTRQNVSLSEQQN